MTKFFSLIILCLAVISTSCINNGDNHYTQSLQANLANRVTTSTGVTTSTTLRYDYDIDFSAMTIRLTVNNAVFANGMPSMTFVLNNIPIKAISSNNSATSTGYSFNVSSIVPTVAGVENPTYTITNLQGIITNDICEVSYNVLGASISARTALYTYNYNTTNVVSLSDPSDVFVDQEATYNILIDATKLTAKIGISKARFAEKMPALEMIFPTVTLTPDANGYTLTKDEIIPEISETPYPNYAVTNFKANITGDYATIEYNCMGRKVSVNASVKQAN